MEDAQAILWLGLEDYAGLWEAVWQLRTLDQHVGESELINRARKSLRQLISRGFISVYRCQEPYGEVVEVGVPELGAILTSDESWREPMPDAVSFRFGTTPAGEFAYKEGPLGSSL